MQQPGNEGAGRGADVRWDTVFVAPDLLVGVLQALSLKGRLPNQKRVAEEEITMIQPDFLWNRSHIHISYPLLLKGYRVEFARAQ